MRGPSVTEVCRLGARVAAPSWRHCEGARGVRCVGAPPAAGAVSGWPVDVQWGVAVRVVRRCRVREDFGKNDASTEGKPQGLPAHELALCDGAGVLVRPRRLVGVSAFEGGVGVVNCTGQQTIQERHVGDLCNAVRANRHRLAEGR